jgi:hypothetical protein
MPDRSGHPGHVTQADARYTTLLLLTIAGAIGLLHLLTNGRYGFHRDELQFLSDARHLDWGFVPYPPMTAFLEHISMSIFGLSIVGLRLFSVLAQASAIVVTGFMARELGGNRLAQIAASLSIALSALPIFEGTEFQYSSFDYLWWVLAAYFFIRILGTDNPKWWLAVGASLGLGLETKYSITFFIAGLLGGMLLTSARRWFLSPWFWAGVGVSLLIFLPNLLWLVRHDFISYQFLQHIHVRDVRQGRGDGFLLDQIRICINPAATILAVAGLIAAFRSSRYRPIAWMLLITVAMFGVGRGRGYYTAPAYPMIVAMGAVACSSWLAKLRAALRIPIAMLYFGGVAFCGAYIVCVLVPLASSGPLREFALAHSSDLREELGWETMLQSIANVRDSLTPEQRANYGIVVGNYGENGAIEILGPKYGLPLAISGTNSAWLHGYPQSQPTTNIVLGVGEDDREAQFTGCKLVATIPYPKEQYNEESNHDKIYVCGPPRLPWPELWKIALSYG